MRPARPVAGPSPRRLGETLALVLLAIVLPFSAAADLDADGVPDAQDVCPRTPDPEQTDRGGIGSAVPDGRGDACQCGDVTRDGLVHISDITVIRRALIGLGPGLAEPSLCNVAGDLDAADADGDGLRDDCDIGDVVALRRALLGLPPGLSSDCRGPGFVPPEQLPPSLRLIGPSRVRVGEAWQATALVADNRRIASVGFFVDGVSVRESAEPPHVLDYNAPPREGRLILGVTAIDVEGNRSEREQAIEVVASEDTAPPEIDRVALPASAAPGDVVRISAAVRDDRSVPRVRFVLGSTLLGSVEIPPYEAALPIPATAPIGARLEIEIQATDASGNLASRRVGLDVVDEGDQQPPALALQVPATAPPGGRITLDADPGAAGDVARIDFSAEGATLGTLEAPPFSLDYAIPEDIAIGSTISFSATATDLSANVSAPATGTTRIVASRGGFVLGEVYDDRRGVPLEGVAVTEPTRGLTTSTDHRGRYRLETQEGVLQLRLALEGYVSTTRRVRVAPGEVVVPRDVRLNPIGARSMIEATRSDTVVSSGGDTLAWPPGALGRDREVTFTRVGEQALPNPLPLGWSPVSTIHLGPEELALRTTPILTLATGPVSDDLTAAVWDEPSGAWLRIPHQPSADADAVELALDRTGFVTVARPDASPTSPERPEPGERLRGVGTVEIPADTVANVLPQPRILFFESEAASEVEILLDPSIALPSGTTVRARFDETYLRDDGSERIPSPTIQDLVLYRGADPRAIARASPSVGFEGGVTSGVIEIGVLSPTDVPLRAVVGPAGTTLATEGATITFPADVLDAEAPVAFEHRAGGISLGEDGETLATLELDVGSARLSGPASLTVDAPSRPDGERWLVARSTSIGGSDRYEWVATARVEMGVAQIDPVHDPVPLPGITSSGRFLLVRFDAPLAFASGQLGSTGAALDHGYVRAASLPLVSRFDGADPRYALPIEADGDRVEAIDLSTGISASRTFDATAADAIVVADLELSPERPRVVRVLPGDDAQGVLLAEQLAVELSSPIDPATASPQTVSLSDGTDLVEIELALTSGDRVLQIRPGALLEPGTTHTLRITSGLRDVFGRALLGDEPDEAFVARFTTLRNVAPPAPASQQITLGIPRGATSEVRGAAGTLLPGDLLVVRNLDRGEQTAIAPRSDGSFYGFVAAERSDRLQLVILGSGGLETRLGPLPFTDPDGSIVLSKAGGGRTTDAGVALTLLPDALVEARVFRLNDEGATGLPALPVGFELVQAFALEAPPAGWDDAEQLEVGARAGPFETRTASRTPLRLASSLVTNDSVSGTSSFSFVARVETTSGRSRALSLEATGSPIPCGATEAAARDDAAPRLRLTAPTCLGPAEPFVLEAEAVQPRLDVSVPAPPDADPQQTWAILRLDDDDAGPTWQLAERARLAEVQGALRIVSSDAAPLGIRRSGRYAVVRASQAIAFVEGFVSGPPALVVEPNLGLASPTHEANGGFLIAVAADAPARLEIRDASGSVIGDLDLAAAPAGASTSVGVIGPDAAAPLLVDSGLPSDGSIAPTADLSFVFSEPVDPASLSAASVVIEDDQGRSVRGDLRLRSGGREVVFAAERPWRLGRAYTFRLTLDVASTSGARLVAPLRGDFFVEHPEVVRSTPGVDVRDATAVDATIFFIDADGIRWLGEEDPLASEDDGGLLLSSRPNRLDVARAPDGDPLLLVTTGASSEYGALEALDPTASPTPTPVERIGLSTPNGAPPRPGVPERPGEPSALAVDGARVVLVNRGLGLQTATPIALDGTPAPGPLTELPEAGDPYVEVSTLAGFVLSVGEAGLRVHRSTTLEPVSTASVIGTPRDVVGARIGDRDLALVAAGLSGGLQVFSLDADGLATRVARVLPGCAVERVTVDAPLERAWLACSGLRLWSLDLGGIDGLDPIDEDLDGVDDRLGGELALPLPLRAFSLDAPRARGLISAGEEGLHVVRLGPAEAVITDVSRDPVVGDRGDAESVASSGRVYFGDRRVEIEIEARIPTGEPDLRLVIASPATPPLSFADGRREIPLSPGRNAIDLRPDPIGNLETPFAIEVRDWMQRVLARFSGVVAPVPLTSLEQVFAAEPRYEVDVEGEVGASLVGRDESGRYYDVTALGIFTSGNPAIARFEPETGLQVFAGGETDLSFQLGRFSGSFEVYAILPARPASIAFEAGRVALRELGASTPLSVSARLTDGTTRSVTAADGLLFESDDDSIVSVSPDGLVTAVGEGGTRFRARLDGLVAEGLARVSLRVPADLDELVLRTIDRSLGPERPIAVEAWVRGTGSLDGLEVSFELEGLGAPPGTRVARTNERGSARTTFRGLDVVGTGDVVARVLDPADGVLLEARTPLRLAARDRDWEPNDSPTEATPIGLDRRLEGSVGPLDPADHFSVELSEAGLVAIELATEGAGALRVRLLDASGAVLAESLLAAGDRSVRLEGPIVPGMHRVVLDQAGVPVAYRLAVELEPSGAEVATLDPPSAGPGDLVEIFGSGFSARLERNDVRFGSLRAEVVSAEPDRLVVRVPAFARNAAVEVRVAGRAAVTGPVLTTGTDGDPAAEAILPPAQPEALIRDPFANNTVYGNRLRLRMEAEAVRADVEAIAAELGGSILGIDPWNNLYTLDVGARDIAALYDLARSVADRALVRAASLDRTGRPTAFPIAGIDALNDTRDDVAAWLRSAYDQINAPAAWRAVIDNGYLEGRPGAPEFGLAPVSVAIFDTRHVENPRNRAVFEGVLSTLDPSQGTVVQPTEDGGSHGTTVSGVIGARNVPIRAGYSEATGILGGVLPPSGDEEALPFYRLLLYEVGFEGDVDDPVVIDMTQVRAVLDGVLCDDAAPPCVPRRESFEVINMSLGLMYAGPQDVIAGEEYLAYPTLTRPDAAVIIRQNRQAAIDAAIADALDLVRSRPDALFVMSAGNEGHLARQHFPSGISLHPEVGDRVIAVGAVGQGFEIGVSVDGESRYVQIGVQEDQGADVRTLFSNYGEGVDLAAPGASVFTPDGSGPTAPASLSTRLAAGTSYAAPLVSGAAALVKAIDPKLRPAELKRLLVRSGTPIDFDEDRLPTIETLFGEARVPLDWGGWEAPVRLDLLAAVHAAFASRGLYDPDQSDTTPVAPGRKRFVYAVEALEQRLTRIQLRPGFDQTLAGVGGDPSFDTTSLEIPREACAYPYGVIASASGDKVYVACRDNDRILVLHSQPLRPALVDSDRDVFPGQPEDFLRATIDLAPHALQTSTIQMDIGRGGRHLVVPIAASPFPTSDGAAERPPAVAVIDTRTDRLVDVLRLPMDALDDGIRGEALAAVLDDKLDLYALTAEPRRTDSGSVSQGGSEAPPELGTLVRFPNVRDGWRADTRLTTVVADDEPRRLAIFEPEQEETIVYALSSGFNQAGAARGYRAGLAEPLDFAPGSFIGGRPLGLPFPRFQPGVLVDVEDTPFMRAQTSRPFDLVIDSDKERAFFTNFGTGNTGVATLTDIARIRTPSPYFNAVQAATEVAGDFEVVAQFYEGVQRGTCPEGASLAILVCIEGNQPTRDEESTSSFTSVGEGIGFGVRTIYTQESFPLDADLDQKGEILVTAYAGDESFLRFHNASRLVEDAIARAIVSEIDILAAVDLPVAIPISPPRLDVPLSGRTVRAVDAGPSFSIAWPPHLGFPLTGPVPVHLTLRDPETVQVECRLEQVEELGTFGLFDLDTRSVDPVTAQIGVVTAEVPGQTLPSACAFEELTEIVLETGNDRSLFRLVVETTNAAGVSARESVEFVYRTGVASPELPEPECETDADIEQDPSDCIQETCRNQRIVRRARNDWCPDDRQFCTGEPVCDARTGRCGTSGDPCTDNPNQCGRVCVDDRNAENEPTGTGRCTSPSPPAELLDCDAIDPARAAFSCFDVPICVDGLCGGPNDTACESDPDRGGNPCRLSRCVGEGGNANGCSFPPDPDGEVPPERQDAGPDACKVCEDGEEVEFVEAVYDSADCAWQQILAECQQLDEWYFVRLYEPARASHPNDHVCLGTDGSVCRPDLNSNSGCECAGNSPEIRGTGTISGSLLTISGIDYSRGQISDGSFAGGRLHFAGCANPANDTCSFPITGNSGTATISVATPNLDTLLGSGPVQFIAIAPDLRILQTSISTTNDRTDSCDVGTGTRREVQALCSVECWGVPR